MRYKVTIEGDIDSTETEIPSRVLALRLAISKLDVYGPRSLTVRADMVEHMGKRQDVFQEYGRMAEHPDR